MVRLEYRLTGDALNDMLFSDFIFAVRALSKQKAEDYRRDMIAASFTAWQIRLQNGEKLSFDEYLSKLGLKEKSAPITKQQRKAMARKAQAKASRIMAMDKGAKKK